MKKPQNIFLIVVVVAILLTLLLQLLSVKKLSKANSELRKEVIENDSLRKIAEGVYQKVVNDLYSNKQLLKEVKKENSELYATIDSKNSQLVLYSQIVATLQEQVDTVIIVQTVEKQDTTYEFNAYYPQKSNYFINYTGNIVGKTVYGRWQFDALPIDIILTENKSGVYEATASAPEWIQIRKLQVNSIPLKPTAPDNFGFVVGGMVGYNFHRNSMEIGAEVGVRYKKSIYSIQGTSGEVVYFGYKKIF